MQQDKWLKIQIDKCLYEIDQKMLEIQGNVMGRNRKLTTTKEQLEDLYINKALSCKSIGKILNVNLATIHNYCI